MTELNSRGWYMRCVLQCTCDDSLLKLELVYFTFDPTIFNLSRQFNDESEPRTTTDPLKYYICIWFSWTCK